MAEVEFEFAGVPYVIDKNDDEWVMPLRRSLVVVRDEADLDVLSYQHHALLPCWTAVDEDKVSLHLRIDPGMLPWEQLRALPRADKLRALINVAECAELVTMGYGFLLHPDNLLFDRNLRIKLAYRGLLGAMPPQDMDLDYFLRQYKALTLSVFEKKASFNSIFEGSMSLKRANDFEKAVTAATSVDELVAYLTSLYDETAAEDAETLVRVGRRKHLTFKHSAIWLGVLAVAASAGVAYYTFMHVPFQERMLEADTHFVKKDYNNVIETLRPVSVNKLPNTQRYELAYSYLRGVNLSEAQLAAIDNNLSLSSEKEFLTYWVQVGRGDAPAALDLAKKLNDIDLVLYALTLSQERVKSDSTLSGTEQETQLKELQDEYDKYLKARTEAVQGGADPSASPAASPASSAPGTTPAASPSQPAAGDPAASATKAGG